MWGALRGRSLLLYIGLSAVAVGVFAVPGSEAIPDDGNVAAEKVVAVLDSATGDEVVTSVDEGNAVDAESAAETVNSTQNPVLEDGAQRLKRPQAETGLYVPILWFSLPSWSVGLCLGVLGYTLAGLGMNLIRLSHLVGGSGKSASVLDKMKETRFNRKTTKNRATVLWSAGYSVNGMGGTINSFGLKFTAQSLMAPLSSVALVSNAVFATCLNGETIRVRRDLGSIVLIFLGNCITVSSGNHSGYRSLTLQEVFLLWTRPAFLAYQGCITVIILASFAQYMRMKRAMDKDGGRERASPQMLVRLGLCHAAGGCILGVNSVLMAKSIMLVLAGGIMNAIFQPGFIVLGVCWAAVASFWLYTLNRLLREYDALFIVPVIEVVWSLMSMISGGIFFGEFHDLYGQRLLFFFMGVALNVTGIWLIGHGKGAPKTEKTQV